MAIGFGDQVRSFACQLVVSFCLHSLVRAGLRLSLIGPRLATVSRTARSQAAGSAGFRSDRAGLITRYMTRRGTANFRQVTKISHYGKSGSVSKFLILHHGMSSSDPSQLECRNLNWIIPDRDLAMGWGC